MGSGGTGKTSFINLIKNRLQSKTKDISETNLTIIEFNPWIYTTQVDLTKEFFSLFLEKLSNQNKNLEEFKENILLILRFLILTFKRLCNKSIPYSELFVDFLNYCLGIIGTKKGLSLQESKRSISEKLRVRNQRFLVIIDDLDRLTAHDIQMVIQLIKSTADFPNVIYLLGYDENIVSASLNSSSINGREYLQKIINIPITLPKIEASLLHNIAYENFRKKYGKPGNT